MKKTFFVSLLIGGICVVGCRPSASAAAVIQPETAAQASAETDPFLKQLAALSPSDRQAYVSAHKKEIGHLVGNPQLLSHLRRIMAGTK